MTTSAHSSKSVVVPLAVVFLFSLSRNGSADPDIANYNNVCGPRCIDYILQRYRRERPPFMQLVRDVQKTPLQKASFEAIKLSLIQQGVQCEFVAIPITHGYTWTEPSVLHIDGGHFVVAERAGNRDVCIWWGDGRTTVVPWYLLRPRLTGLVLLTSNTDISANGVCFELPYRRWVFICGTSLVLAGILLRSVSRLIRRDTAMAIVLL